jgi:hypothetical protein
MLQGKCYDEFGLSHSFRNENSEGVREQEVDVELTGRIALAA